MKIKKINYLLLLIATISLSGCSFADFSLDQFKTTSETKPVINNKNIPIENSAKEINIVAYNFFYSTSEITVHKGDKITINLSSADGQHDITINDFNIQSTVVDLSNSTKISFVADKAGEFEFYSSIGNQKELGLVGKLIVLE